MKFSLLYIANGIANVFQELTGLGNRKQLNYPEIDMRYKYTSEIAKNYAVISLGLSCFTCRSVSDVTVDDENGKAFFLLT